jgi:hypothetical protein
MKRSFQWFLPVTVREEIEIDIHNNTLYRDFQIRRKFLECRRITDSRFSASDYELYGYTVKVLLRDRIYQMRNTNVVSLRHTSRNNF